MSDGTRRRWKRFEGGELTNVCVRLSLRIFGMDFFVVMGRPGARVAKRKHCTARIGFPHRVKREQSQVRPTFRCVGSFPWAAR